MDMHFKGYAAMAILLVLLGAVPADQTAVLLLLGFACLVTAGYQYVFNGNPVYG